MSTIVIHRKLLHAIDDDYAALLDCADIDDALFDLLHNKLKFRTNDDDKELVAVHARGSIVPDSVDEATVCLDAMIWFDEQSRELNSRLLAYDLADRFECYPQYVQAKDVVIFRLHPLAQNDLEDVEAFVLPNAAITVLTCLLLGSVIANCLLLMQFS